MYSGPRAKTKGGFPIKNCGNDRRVVVPEIFNQGPRGEGKGGSLLKDCRDDSGWNCRNDKRVYGIKQKLPTGEGE